MKAKIGLAAVLAAATLSGCETTAGSAPVDVTRFHLDPIERGSIAIEPVPGAMPGSIEFDTYAAAIQTQLLQIGYTAAAPGTAGQYVAVVGLSRTSQPIGPARSPLTIGLGGGGYSGGYRGGGVGLGGGISFPVGKPRQRSAIFSQLSVQIRRRSDGTAIWEGRAQTAADERSPDAQAGAAAAKMAHALFLGFPGETGRTITVK